MSGSRCLQRSLRLRRAQFEDLLPGFHIGARTAVHLSPVQMEKNVGKVRNQDINPCMEESDASQKCLDVYNYDKSMCSASFIRYRNCRKYWHSIMIQRRREGVRPEMPPAAERMEMLNAIGGKPY